MSDATVQSSRNIFRRIFHALVGDATPEGVDPTLHRRALWWAFSICAWGYSIRFLLGLPAYSTNFSSFLADKCWWYLRMLSHLPGVGPPDLFVALLLPVFIYAIVLKRNGARLPLAAIEIAAVSLVAYVILETIVYLTFYLTMGLTALLVLLVARRHLRSRITSVLIGITFIPFLLSDSIHTALTLDGMEIWRFEWFSASFVALTSWFVYAVLWLPLSVALPISLLGNAPTPTLRPRAERSWSLLWVFLLTAAIVIACHLAPYIVKIYIFPGRTEWMVTTLLLVMILWLYKTGRASRELLTYLVLSFAGIVVVLTTLYYADRTAIALAIGGVVALLLAGDLTMARRKALAIGSLAFNAVAVSLWYRLVFSDLIRLRTIWYTGPEGWSKACNPMLTAKFASASLVLLAIIIGALLFAWWFMKPREIEALMPWKRKE